MHSKPILHLILVILLKLTRSCSSTSSSVPSPFPHHPHTARWRSGSSAAFSIHLPTPKATPRGLRGWGAAPRATCMLERRGCVPLGSGQAACLGPPSREAVAIRQQQSDCSVLRAFHGFVMNRDTANILQNAPSPWETASTDTLKLFQSQQIQEMRLVEGDGHRASQLQAGEEVAPFSLKCHPEMMTLGDAWVNCRARFFPLLKSTAGLSLGGGNKGTVGNGGDGCCPCPCGPDLPYGLYRRQALLRLV